MPWHQKSMKDVATCDKLRQDGNSLRPEDLRMGKPSRGNALESRVEYIGTAKTTGGTETSKYPLEKKTIVIP